MSVEESLSDEEGLFVKGVLYIDRKGREVLYVPFVCVVTNYMRKEPDVILEPERLKRRQLNWKAGRTSVEKIISYFDIDREDIDSITELCFQNRISEAKGYCVDVFDYFANASFKIE